MHYERHDEGHRSLSNSHSPKFGNDLKHTPKKSSILMAGTLVFESFQIQIIASVTYPFGEV